MEELASGKSVEVAYDPISIGLWAAHTFNFNRPLPRSTISKIISKHLKVGQATKTDAKSRLGPGKERLDEALALWISYCTQLGIAISELGIK